MNIRTTRIVSNVLQWVVILILAVPTFYKLSGHAAAVELFQDLGLGAGARITVGVIEALTIVLLIFRRTVWLGGLLGSLTMTGAMLTHIYLGKYAFDYGGGGSDGGGTMIMGVVALFCCMAILTLNEDRFPFFRHWKMRDLETARQRDDAS